MKTNIAAILIASFLLVPTFTSAESRFGIEPTLGQLLTRIAALQAILEGKPINCAVTSTKTTVRVGEPFTIAWGSYGADAKYSIDPENAYSENGEQTMRMDMPQMRTYYFTFFGPNGLKKTCNQTITVTG